MDKPKEFWILESRCSMPLRTFYSEEDSFDEMQINDNHIHVIEYSAYEQLHKRFEEAVEVIRHYSAHHSTDIEYHKWDADNLKLIPMGRFSDKAKDFLRSLDKGEG